MRPYTVALFGEAEKGDFQTAYYCQSIHQLAEYFGNPPEESQGIHYAVQALMHDYNLIFFRVEEEGYSREDYLLGFKLLKNCELTPGLAAVCLPGVGDSEIIDAGMNVCSQHRGILVMNEKDFYDYLMS